jgi:hypothetical protein
MGMPADGAVSYFGAGAIPPATILFRQEAKLRGTSLCLFELDVWIRNVRAFSRPLYLAIVSVISHCLSGRVRKYNSSSSYSDGYRTHAFLTETSDKNT